MVTYFCCVQNKMTFYLTLASTLAIALYGVIGALYVEAFRSAAEEGNRPVKFLLWAMVAIGCATAYCFTVAYLTMKKSRDQV
jgi:hypothetical protein